MSLAIYAFLRFFIYRIYGGLTSVLSIFVGMLNAYTLVVKKYFQQKRTKLHTSNE